MQDCFLYLIPAQNAPMNILIALSVFIYKAYALHKAKTSIFPISRMIIHMQRTKAKGTMVLIATI